VASMPKVDKTKIAAVGYCFGGMAALELARSGAELRGTATLHGLLSTPKPASTKNVKGAVLVMTGDLDSMVPAKQVMSFSKEMRDAKADWQIVTFGGAMHAFSVPSANSPKEGMAYNRRTDMRSWSILVDFLAEVLGETVH
ncbi:MAG: dienelactone hydrolase family protein, partial [Deltaproteobacteria bacterium]